MSKLDEILKVTPGDSQRTLSELVHKAIAENRITFDGIAETLVDEADDNATEVSGSLIKCYRTTQFCILYYLFTNNIIISNATKINYNSDISERPLQFINYQNINWLRQLDPLISLTYNIYINITYI